MRPDLWNILEPIQVDPRVKSWKDVLRNLVFHANDNGEAWPNIETIRLEVGYKSRKAVIDALAGLEHCGLIGRVRTGKGRATKLTYQMTFDAKTVNSLSNNVNKCSTSEPTLPILSTNGEVTFTNNGKPTSPIGGNGEVTSNNGEVTSNNGEVTSHRIKQEINKNPPPSSIADNGEVTSPNVDNSAKDTATKHQTGHAEKPLRGGYDGKGGVPPRTGVMALLDPRPVDYLALCKKPGWRPNDPKQTPPCDFDKAKRAVIACAYRAKLSVEKAKEFWHYNAIRKWNAIDCGSTIAELAFAFAQRWLEEYPDEYYSEQHRRKVAAANRLLT